jgi:hypothetical protein
MKICTATNGTNFLVDDEDYEKVIQYNWTENPTGYFKRMNKKQGISLHRWLINCPVSLEVDHIDHNPLNNCKVNLRICTKSQNAMNRIPKKHMHSNFKGVTWHIREQKWVVQINSKHLGYFKLELDAAKAYNKAALELFGEYAYLNKVGDV